MLPSLPRINKRCEAKIDGLVLDWFLNNYPEDVWVEVKIKGNKMLPHQEAAGKQVANGKFKYKFPDMGRRTPGDGVVLVKAIPFCVTCDGMMCEAHNLKTGEKFNIHIKKGAA
jgi:hypothetical protein